MRSAPSSATPPKAAAFEREWGVASFGSAGDLLAAASPRFLVVSVPQPAAPEVIGELAGSGVPILCETPPANSLEGLRKVAGLVADGAQLQIAEQYIFQPMHAARLAVVATGRIGRPSHAHVSLAHGYHGISLMRHFLGVRFENARIRARTFSSDIVAGPGRAGPPVSESMARSEQLVAELDFGDRLGIFDFTGDQYFSWIRSPRLLVRGERGEIKDEELRYLADFRTPVTLRFDRQDTGHGGNLEGYFHRGVLAGADWVYRNPFVGARLSDDEIAVATCLDGMEKYAADGTEFYSFADAAQDQYLSLLIEEARRSGNTVASESQPWARG